MSQENTPTSSTDRQTGHQAACLAFLDAFQKMFKIGIYYQIGHQVMDQAAGKFIQKLRVAFPGTPTVSITLEPERLLVEDVVLSLEDTLVAEVHQFLTRLGIDRLEFDRVISHKHFLQFVKSLLAWRSQLEVATSLIDFRLDGLPASVRVRQREYLVEQAAVKSWSADDPSVTLDSLMESLGRQGLNQKQLKNCRNLLTALSHNAASSPTEIRGYPNITWMDVEALLVRVVKFLDGKNPAELGDIRVDEEINALTGIFASLENDLQDRDSKYAVRMLVSHLKGGANRDKQQQELSELAEGKAEDTGLVKKRPAMSAEEIQDFISSNRLPFSVLEKVPGGDRTETFSILLQILLGDSEDKSKSSATRIIKGLLGQRLTLREKGLLFTVLLEFVEKEDKERFADLLNMIVGSLREAADKGSLGFLVEFWGKMPHTLHSTLWPHLVTELLLVGPEKNSEAFFEAVEIAGHMHPDTMRRMRNQLEEHEVFTEKKVAKDVFKAAYIYSYQLFSFLLETSLAERLYPVVLTALQADPQDALFRSVSQLLSLEIAEHRDFLRLYLSQAHFEELPLLVRMVGGRILVDSLSALPETRRGEEWVPAAIEATGDFQVDDGQGLARRILTEKKLAVLPMWPKACRKAAQVALRKMSKKPLTELL